MPKTAQSQTSVAGSPDTHTHRNEAARGERCHWRSHVTLTRASPSNTPLSQPPKPATAIVAIGRAPETQETNLLLLLRRRAVGPPMAELAFLGAPFERILQWRQHVSWTIVCGWEESKRTDVGVNTQLVNWSLVFGEEPVTRWGPHHQPDISPLPSLEFRPLGELHQRLSKPTSSER